MILESLKLFNLDVKEGSISAAAAGSRKLSKLV